MQTFLCLKSLKLARDDLCSTVHFKVCFVIERTDVKPWEKMKLCQPF